MEEVANSPTNSGSKMKFVMGGALIVAAVIYLIVSSTQASAQYFLTVDEVIAKGDEVHDRDLRVSGAVIGDTIEYDREDLKLTFTVAHVPGDNSDVESEGGLAQALHNAVTDPSRPRMQVVYEGPMPDLLQHEAQAIMTGRLREDGVFHADELLLKCPTKYEEVVPEQASSQ